MLAEQQWKPLCNGEEIQKRLNNSNTKELVLNPNDDEWCSSQPSLLVLQSWRAREMHQPKPASELGGPEDADTCWLLGYVHVSNVTESISPCVEIKMCFARWLGSDACVYVASCAALKSVRVTKMMKCNCFETRLALSTCLSASLNQDIDATLNSSWCVLHVKIFLAG